jgi:serine/threonine-protein kinase
MTETGLSLGTPHYMSPEQATADKDLTSRSDIYSLGAMLYEMLTGDPPHTGSTAQQVIAKIVTEEPALVTKARKSVPSNVAAAVAMALEKLPADRFESAKSFAEALTNPAFTTAAVGAGLPSVGPSVRQSVLVPVLAATTILFAALAAWGWLRPTPRPPVARFLVSVPDDRPLAMGQYIDVAISRDATRFAYIGIGEDGGTRVFVRDFNAYDVLPVAGSENVDEFAFSPDGKEMMVRVDGELRRTGWLGGAPRTIADSAYVGPVWGEDDFVYFADIAGNLVRTPAGGGPVERVVGGSRLGVRQWSDILPDRRAGLFVERPPAVLGVEPTVMIADFTTGSTRPLARGVQALYRAGRIIFLKRDGSVWAAPFDADRLSLGREPIAVTSIGVRSTAQAQASFAMSSSGTFIYASRPGRGVPPVRVRRDGGETPYPFTVPFSQGPRLSPDGRRLAATLVDGFASDVHVVDLADGSTTRLTFDGASAYPEWSPDGRRVAYFSLVDSVYQMRWRLADASAPAEPLIRGPARPVEIVFLPGGRSFITREGDRSTNDNADLFRYDMAGDSLIRTPLTRTAANERSPMISPDGRYVAFVSDEAGRDEIYVRETRPSENVWPVSRDGGREPLWARSGRELFYRGGGKLVRVGVRTSPTFAVTEAARELFPVGEYLENYNHTAYGILPGDETFVFVRIASPLNRLAVVMNWMDEVNELLAGGR